MFVKWIHCKHAVCSHTHTHTHRAGFSYFRVFKENFIYNLQSYFSTFWFHFYQNDHICRQFIPEIQDQTVTERIQQSGNTNSQSGLN